MSEHHTPEQVKKAFAYAPTVLRKLKEAGVGFPSLKLYDDASGQLSLGDNPTQEQCDLAISLVRSRRRCMCTGEVSIDFCCGLVTAAEEAEESDKMVLSKYTCEHTLISPGDTDHVQWGGYKVCTICKAIVAPDGSIFMEGCEFLNKGENETLREVVS